MANTLNKAYKGKQEQYFDEHGILRRMRKLPHKFDNLFLSNKNVFEDSIDDFKIPKSRKTKKSMESPLFSKNETFDVLIKDSENSRTATSIVPQYSNSCVTSCENMSSSFSDHYLSPFTMPKRQKIQLPNLKCKSPDPFSESAMANKISISNEKYSPKERKIDNEVRLSSFEAKPGQSTNVLLSLDENDSIDEAKPSEGIVTSTPAFTRITHDPYLHRLNHISPLRREIPPYGNVPYPDRIDFVASDIPDSSVYLSAKKCCTVSNHLDGKNNTTIHSIYKSIHTKQMPGIQKIKQKTMVKIVLDKESTLMKGVNRNIHSVRQTMSFQNLSISKDGNFSINLCRGKSKNWKRTLRKTVNQLSETCLLKKAEIDAIGENVEHFHSRSLLEALSLSSDKIPVEKSGESIFFELCQQDKPLTLAKIFPKSTSKFCKKIGEGIYGEVFARKNTKIAEEIVVKLIPIGGGFFVNGEPQKTFKEIASELIVSLAVTKLIEGNYNCCQNFPFLLRGKCLKGKYTSDLIKLWDQYYEKNGSENDRPNLFPKDQLYLMLEFNHAGADLETYELSNAMQGYSIFLQVAYALGTAEECLEFEHRDLHWGNILIKSTDETFLSYLVKGKEYTVQSRGLKATIIDFTLSRLKENDQVYFNDLSKDPTLFITEGDYQFDIYRQMRNLNKNNWSNFNPKTNIFWLHYLVKKLISDCIYRNKSSKIHKKFMTRLRRTETGISSFASALQFVINAESFLK